MVAPVAAAWLATGTTTLTSRRRLGQGCGAQHNLTATTRAVLFFTRYLGPAAILPSLSPCAATVNSASLTRGAGSERWPAINSLLFTWHCSFSFSRRERSILDAKGNGDNLLVLLTTDGNRKTSAWLRLTDPTDMTVTVWAVPLVSTLHPL